DRSPPYHPQFEKGKPYKSARKARYDANTGRHLRAALSENPGFRYPRSVLHVPSESNTVHHTQKPLALFEYLIKTYTNPEELVLDSCMGSGTTAIACLNTGRNFIGLKPDPAVFKPAHHRRRPRKGPLQEPGAGEPPPSEASASHSSDC